MNKVQFTLDNLVYNIDINSSEDFTIALPVAKNSYIAGKVGENYVTPATEIEIKAFIYTTANPAPKLKLIGQDSDINIVTNGSLELKTGSVFEVTFSTVDGGSTWLVNSSNATASTAEEAINIANNASELAEEASTTATTAENKAAEAQVLANTANENAQKAVITANGASNDVTLVKSTANSASETANTAKETAETAQQTASTAKTTAETATSTANTAKSTAETAKSTADTAKAATDSLNTKYTDLEARVKALEDAKASA